jgi:hypothetical protein
MFCESNYLRIVLHPSYSHDLPPWNFYLLNLPKFERPFSMSECILWALILCNTQICVSFILSILCNILSAPARIHGKELKDFPDTLYLHFASFSLQLLFQNLFKTISNIFFSLQPVFWNDIKSIFNMISDFDSKPSSAWGPRRKSSPAGVIHHEVQMANNNKWSVRIGFGSVRISETRMMQTYCRTEVGGSGRMLTGRQKLSRQPGIRSGSQERQYMITLHYQRFLLVSHSKILQYSSVNWSTIGRTPTEQFWVCNLQHCYYG